MSLYNKKRAALMSFNNVEPNLTLALRSLSVIGNPCDAPLIINCRVDTTGNANPNIFETGNIVYNNYSGLVPFNGNNLNYVIVSLLAPSGQDIQLCQVNNIGEITTITDYNCT